MQVTQGNIYNKSLDNLMNAYLKIPEKIRMVFENEGFKIKMTEEDIVYEAYAPYGRFYRNRADKWLYNIVVRRISNFFIYLI